MRILVVEDEELDVIALQRAFKKHAVPYEMTIVRNGAEALQFLKEEPPLHSPLLIILDVNMPGMNGIEFLRELRGNDSLKQLPVFMLTTSDEKRDVDSAYNLGVSGYLLKQNIGADFEKLIALITAYANVVLFPSP